MKEALTSLWRLNTPYIKPEQYEAIRTYKYIGTDNSFTYNYFYRPLSLKIVQHLPTWLAPNTITVCSLLCVFIPHVFLFTFYGSELSGPVPSWLIILTIILFQIYNILDNVDGQQARKTGSSSPLGLLFDHQIDALIAFIFGISMMRILQIGNSPFIVYAFSCSSIPFFYTTLQEYYVGGLYLPMFNLVSEGPLFLEGILAFTVYKGTDFWVQRFAFFGLGPYMLSEWLVLFFLFCQVPPGLKNVINILKVNPGKRRLFFANLGMFNFLIFSMYLVAWYSKCQIMDTNPIAFLYMYGLSFVKITAHIQLAHVSNAKFHPFRKPILLFSGFMFINSALGWAFEGDCPVSQLRMLVMLLLLTLGIVHVIHEMTTILGIKCFIIEQKSTKTS